MLKEYLSPAPQRKRQLYTERASCEINLVFILLRSRFQFFIILFYFFCKETVSNSADILRERSGCLKNVHKNPTESFFIYVASILFIPAF